MSNLEDFRCGFVALIGEPNVGKSSLLNALIEQKISIITAKAQTTRHCIKGILNTKNSQIILVDTPGIHQINHRLGGPKILNQAMNKVAITSAIDADIVLLMIDATQTKSMDNFFVWQKINKNIQSNNHLKVFLILNKIDKFQQINTVLEKINQLSKTNDFLEIIPISAKKNYNLDILLATITKHLPKGQPWYEKEQITDRDDNFLIAEIIREKVMNFVHKEVPYGTTVIIEDITKKGDATAINATILVEKKGQKSIIIGKAGEKIKQIGSSARFSLSAFLQTKVHLQLWVKVKENWAIDVVQSELS